MPQRRPASASPALDQDLLLLCVGGIGAEYGGGGGSGGGSGGSGSGGGDFGGDFGGDYGGDYGGGDYGDVGDFGGGYGDVGNTGDNFGNDFGALNDSGDFGNQSPTPTTMLQSQGDSVLNQGSIGDCSAVATLREIGSTPEGQAYLNSMVQEKGDGFYQVTLVGADGQAQLQTVWLHPGEVFGDGNPTAMAIEKALVYNAQSAAGIEGMNGIRVDTVMNQLGLTDVSYGPPTNALNVGIQNQILVGGTPELGPVPAGLVPNHAYGVSGTVTDANGNLSVVLSNPWGSGQPDAINADQIGTAIDGVTTGTVPWPDP